ncbi:MAG: hypothetical protein ABSB40_08445 [Nitrososphaeria archaeon]
MNRNAKIQIIFITLIAVAVLATFWASMNLFQPPFGEREPREPVTGDIELYYTVTTVISTINFALLLILLITYFDMYLKTKSEFLIGLMIFALVMLLNALTSNQFITQIFGFRAFGLGPFALLPDLFTFIALVILLYLTFKY